MTAVRKRYATRIASAYAIAALSQLQGTVNGAPIILTTPTAHAFGPGRSEGLHQPNPLARLYPTDLRTHLQSPSRSITASQPARPLLSFVWTNPRGYVYPVSLRTATNDLIHTTLTDQSDVPETCSWGNAPSGRPFPVAVRTWTPPNLVISAPVETPTVFRAPSRAPRLVASPWVAIRANDLRYALPIVTATVASPQPAVTQPVPKGYPYPVALRTWAEHANLDVLSAPPTTVAKIRPAVITRYAKRRTIAAVQSQSGVTGANLNVTLVPNISGYQLVSGDWPNPNGPIYPQSLRTWTQTGNRSLAASQPKVQIDQPNPSGPVYPTSLRTWLQEPNPGLLFVAPTDPLRPFDWPNPLGYAFSVELRTWTQNPLTLKGQDEFFGVGAPVYDWPNPLGYAYPTSLRTFTQGVTIELSEAPSLVPFDWPNPRGYVYPTSLRTFTQGFSKPISAAASLRPYDWPNPAPARMAIDLRTIAQSIPLVILEAISATPPLGVNIDLVVVLATDGLQLTVCLNKDVDLSVTTNCTIELKVP